MMVLSVAMALQLIAPAATPQVANADTPSSAGTTIATAVRTTSTDEATGGSDYIDASHLPTYTDSVNGILRCKPNELCGQDITQPVNVRLNVMWNETDSNNMTITFTVPYGTNAVTLAPDSDVAAAASVTSQARGTGATQAAPGQPRLCTIKLKTTLLPGQMYNIFYTLTFMQGSQCFDGDTGDLTPHLNLSGTEIAVGEALTVTTACKTILYPCLQLANNTRTPNCVGPNPNFATDVIPFLSPTTAQTAKVGPTYILSPGVLTHMPDARADYLSSPYFSASVPKTLTITITLPAEATLAPTQAANFSNYTQTTVNIAGVDHIVLTTSTIANMSYASIQSVSRPSASNIAVIYNAPPAGGASAYTYDVKVTGTWYDDSSIPEVESSDITQLYITDAVKVNYSVVAQSLVCAAPSVNYPGNFMTAGDSSGASNATVCLALDDYTTLNYWLSNSTASGEAALDNISYNIPFPSGDLLDISDFIIGSSSVGSPIAANPLVKDYLDKMTVTYSDGDSAIFSFDDSTIFSQTVTMNGGGSTLYPNSYVTASAPANWIMSGKPDSAFITNIKITQKQPLAYGDTVYFNFKAHLRNKRHSGPDIIPGSDTVQTQMTTTVTPQDGNDTPENKAATNRTYPIYATTDDIPLGRPSLTAALNFTGLPGSTSAGVEIPVVNAIRYSGATVNYNARIHNPTVWIAVPDYLQIDTSTLTLSIGSGTVNPPTGTNLRQATDAEMQIQPVNTSNAGVNLYAITYRGDLHALQDWWLQVNYSLIIPDGTPAKVNVPIRVFYTGEGVSGAWALSSSVNIGDPYDVDGDGDTTNQVMAQQALLNILVPSVVSNPTFSNGDQEASTTWKKDGLNIPASPWLASNLARVKSEGTLRATLSNGTSDTYPGTAYMAIPKGDFVPRLTKLDFNQVQLTTSAVPGTLALTYAYTTDTGTNPSTISNWTTFTDPADVPADATYLRFSGISLPPSMRLDILATYSIPSTAEQGQMVRANTVVDFRGAPIPYYSTSNSAGFIISKPSYKVYYYKDSVDSVSGPNYLGSSSETDAVLGTAVSLDTGTGDGQLNQYRPVGYQDGEQQSAPLIVREASSTNPDPATGLTNVINVVYKSLSYTVHYSPNGGTPATYLDSDMLAWTSAGFLPATAPQKTGYTFNGWKSPETGVIAGPTTPYSDLVNDESEMEVTLVADWAANTYTVKYDANTVDTDGQPLVGSVIGTTPNSTHTYDVAKALTTNGYSYTGYTSAGWNTASDGTGTSYPNSQPVTNLTDEAGAIVTLYAQWTPVTYSVTYDGNGYTGGTIPPVQNVKAGASFNVATQGDLVCAGKVFTGWNSVANGSGTAYAAGSAATMPASNLTLYAQWSAGTNTVTYDAGGGTLAAGTVNPKTGVLWSDDNLLPADPSRSGWTFTGWDVTVGGSKTKVTSQDKYSDLASDDTIHAITLTATWSEDSYTISYLPGIAGTFNEADSSASYGEATPAAPTVTGMTGWTFTGWSPAVAATVTGNATYTAQWTRDSYIVTFAPGLHGTFSPQATTNLYYGDITPVAPMTPGDAGWTFASWDVTPSLLVSGTVTYTATWTQDSYSVTYAPGTQGTFSAQTTDGLHLGDSTPAAPATTPGNTGWNFNGWSPAPSATVTGDITYTATWAKDSYTVSFAPGTEGTFTAQTTSGLYYGDFTPTAPTPAGNPGYSFAGWSPALGTNVTGTVTYTAQWTRDSYSVTYEPGTQGTFSAQTSTGLHYGDTTPAAPASVPGNAGWNFNGWTPAVASTVTGNATYVATWAQNTYSVTFAPGSQGTFSPVTTDNLHYSDLTPAAPATPGNTGWTFAGWSPAVATNVTATATYTATWTQNEYTVTYDPGSEGAFSTTVITGLHYGDTTPAAPASIPGNTGWNFNGWTPAVAPTVTGNATYTATWAKDTYSVTFAPGTQGAFSAVNTDGLHYGDLTPTAPATPGNAGWTFTGWSPAVATNVTATVTYTAQWAQESYSVTYAPGTQGTFNAQVTTGLHMGATMPAAPAATPGSAGYSFAGWSPTPAATVTGDVTYTAQWTQNNYTVTFAPGTHGAFSSQVNTNLHYGDVMPTAPATPGDPGWTFAGWDATPSLLVSGTVTYTATWTRDAYTVSYMPGLYGTFAATQTTGLHYGDATPAAPTATPGQPGWSFDGWSPAPTSTVTGTAIYVATWTQTLYTVSFEPGTQGTFITDTHLSLTYGSPTPVAPAVTGNNGWTFTGWSPALSSLVTGNATYVAQWEQDNYTVSYLPGTQGAFNAQVGTNLHYGDTTPAAPATPGNSGYTFTGWSPVVASTVTGNAIYTAQWSQDSYTISFEPGTKGTFSAQSTSGLHYGEVTPPSPTVTGTPGYSFTGWSPTLSNLVSGSVTYIATWQANTNTVTYAANGATSGAVPASQQAQTDADFTVSGCGTLQRAGYTFEGWNTASDGTGTGYSVGDTVAMGPADITLYAVWQAINYTVTYLPGSQGTFAAQVTANLHYGDLTPVAPAPAGNLGWTFAGWSPVVATLVSSDAIYTATWTQNDYSVIYDANGGVLAAGTLNKTGVHWTDTGIIAPDPSYGGHIFAGWKVTAGGSSAGVLTRGADPAYADLAANDKTNSITLTAQWDPAPYDVTVKYYLSDKPGSLIGTKVLSGQLFGSSIALNSALLDAYKPAHGYSSGTSPAAPAYTVIDGTNTITVTYVQTEFVITILYHALDGSGKVIAQEKVDPVYGQVIDPAPWLNKHKPAGYGNGVALGTPWVVTDAVGGNVFDIYYPNTAPVIKVTTNMIMVNKGTKLSIADIIKMSGAYVIDPEESISPSKIMVAGYDQVRWSVVNYPAGDGYVLTMTVKDSTGAISPVRQIAIYVQGGALHKPKKGETAGLGLKKPPAGYVWLVNASGMPVLVKKADVLRLSARALLPATGDGLSAEGLVASVGALLAAAGSVLLLTSSRRRRMRTRDIIPLDD